jgi:hypothetical protein
MGATLEPAIEEVVIVVAGDDDHLSPLPEDGAQLGEELPARGQRLAQRTVPELEHVAEQDDTIDALER